MPKPCIERRWGYWNIILGGAAIALGLTVLAAWRAFPTEAITCDGEPVRSRDALRNCVVARAESGGIGSALQWLVEAGFACLARRGDETVDVPVGRDADFGIQDSPIECYRYREDGRKRLFRPGSMSELVSTGLVVIIENADGKAQDVMVQTRQ